jgi:hypothetical protein
MRWFKIRKRYIKLLLLADTSLNKKEVNIDNIDSSARFNNAYINENPVLVESKIIKDSLPMINFYQSANIDLSKAERMSKKLCERSLMLRSPDSVG